MSSLADVIAAYEAPMNPIKHVEQGLKHVDKAVHKAAKGVGKGVRKVGDGIHKAAKGIGKGVRNVGKSAQDHVQKGIDTVTKPITGEEVQPTALARVIHAYSNTPPK